jgi:murein tripeptide amidase MpaA
MSRHHENMDPNYRQAMKRYRAQIRDGRRAHRSWKNRATKACRWLTRRNDCIG